MDPLSMTASIAAVVTITAQIVGYIRDTKDATKDMRRFSDELTATSGLLVFLSNRVSISNKHDPWYAGVKELNKQDNGIFIQFENALRRLESQLDLSGGFKKAIKILTWSNAKQDVKDVLLLVERMKSAINLALSDDLYQLSLALKEDYTIQQNQLRKQLSGISGDLTDLKIIAQTKEEKELIQRIADWVPAARLQIAHGDVSSKRLEGTGDWLLRTQEFMSWLNGPDPSLWCLGIPGAGKTVLASRVIDHLTETFLNPGIAIIHVYFNYKEREEQTSEKLVANLLKQLVLQTPRPSKATSWLFRQTSGKDVSPRFRDLVSALHAEMKQFSRVFVVIDALDECNDDDGACRGLLESLKNAPACVRWLVTSRPLPSIQDEVNDSSTIDIAAAQEDVESYVRGRMDNEKTLRKVLLNQDQLRELIVDTILKTFGGMFLLAKLHMDSLASWTKPKAIREALPNLPKTVEGTYDDAMLRIGLQNDHHVSLAHRVLMWISNARRPLTLQELQYAISIEPDANGFDEEDLEVEDIFLSACAGLVVSHQGSGTIRLVHETAQEYFSSANVRERYFPHAMRRIAGTCLAYLSFDFTSADVCTSDEAMALRLEQYPLLHYASTQWGYHAASCLSEDLESRVLEFLKDESRLAFTSQVLFLHDYDYNEFEGYSRYAHRNPPPLCVLSYFDLPSMFNEFENDEVHKACSLGRQPLHYAAEHGRLNLVQSLSDRGANINAIDVDGLTAIHLATAKGHHDVVLKLIDLGASLEFHIRKYDGFNDRTGGTPLHLAAMSGNLSIIETLIEKKANVESMNAWRRTPLHLATKGQELAAIRLLVSKGANIEAQRDGGETALGFTMEPWAHRFQSAKLLLSLGASPLSFGHEGTPLEKAIVFQKEEMIVLFKRINDMSGGQLVRKTIEIFFAIDFRRWHYYDRRLEVARTAFPVMLEMIKDEEERREFVGGILSRSKDWEDPKKTEFIEDLAGICDGQSEVVNAVVRGSGKGEEIPEAEENSKEEDVVETEEDVVEAEEDVVEAEEDAIVSMA